MKQKIARSALSVFLKSAFSLVICFIISHATLAFSQGATESVPDLWENYHTSNNDSIKLTRLTEIAFRYVRSNPDSAALLASFALEQAKEKGLQSVEAAAYLSLADTYNLRGSADTALIYYNKGIAIYQSQRHLAGLRRGYNSRGSYYFNIAQFDKALKDYEQCLQLSIEENNHSVQASILHNLGRVYARKNNYYEALSHYLNARNLKDSLINAENPPLTEGSYANTLINLGALYQELSQYELAKQANQEALSIFDEDKPYPRMIVLYNIGILEEELDNFDAAESLLKESLEIAEDLNALPNQPYYHDALGNVFREKDQLELAETYYRNALDLLDTIVQNPILKAGVLCNLGLLYNKKEKYLEALNIGQEALDLAQQKDASREILNAHDLIAKAAFGLENYELASLHQRAFIFRKDSLDGEDRKKELIGLQAVKDVELAEAHHERDKAQLKTDITQKWNQYLRITVFLVFLLAVALAIARRSLSKANAQLNSTNKDLGENNVKLFTSNQQLGIANNKLQQFAFAAGHDLKESLRNITSFTQLASLEVPKDSKAFEHLDVAAAGGKRMRKMLDDLLHFGNIHNTRNTKEQLRLNEIIFSAKSLLTEDINQTKGDIHLQCQVKFRAERIAIEQLFFNLLHNSLIYKREGHPPRISVNCEQQGKDLVFIIKDNGMGIEEAYKEDVFLPFNRLHNRSISGAGLGLAICQRIVKEYGGKIYVAHTTPHGTIIHFTLPGTNPQIIPVSL